MEANSLPERAVLPKGGSGCLCFPSPPPRGRYLLSSRRWHRNCVISPVCASGCETVSSGAKGKGSQSRAPALSPAQLLCSRRFWTGQHRACPSRMNRNSPPAGRAQTRAASVRQRKVRPATSENPKRSRPPVCGQMWNFKPPSLRKRVLHPDGDRARAEALAAIAAAVADAEGEAARAQGRSRLRKRPATKSARRGPASQLR